MVFFTNGSCIFIYLVNPVFMDNLCKKDKTQIYKKFIVLQVNTYLKTKFQTLKLSYKHRLNINM